MAQVLSGAEVLTGAEIFRNFSENPGFTAQQGIYFALISSTPGSIEDGADPMECPITQSVTRMPLDNVDQDTFAERDISMISQDFTVSSLPNSLYFYWSFLNSETVTEFHDDFEVLLTPIAPPGAPIKVLTVTAGNQNIAGFPYTGDFTFLNPVSFDAATYEVVTNPAGGATDCFYADLGRTGLVQASYAIPSTGTWRVSFYFGDDGGDARMDGGAIIDDVKVEPPGSTPTATITPTPTITSTATHTATSTSTPTSTPTPFVYGDIDCSGGLNPVDATYVLCLFVGNCNDSSFVAPCNTAAERLKRSDWDCNGAITPIDATYGLAVFVGSITSGSTPLGMNPPGAGCP